VPSSAFHSTRPHFDTTLPRVSDFQRRLQQGGPGDGGAPSTLQASLHPSMLQDLQRFVAPAQGGPGLEALEVMAAAVRHCRALRLMLAHESHVLPLTVMPRQRLVHGPLPLAQWSLLRWSTMKVLQVEPVDTEDAPGPGSHSAPLGLVLWALALHGTRAELLPEIAGPVGYRITPTTDLSGLDMGGLLAAAVERLQRQTTTLAEISQWPGFDRERATRLLNGLYLQAGLMVTRSHR